MLIKMLKYMMMDENTYIVSDERTGKAFIVDPSVELEKIDGYLQENNLTLDYIILTHGHVDHIMSVKKLKEKYREAKILAHEEEKDLLSDARKNLSSMFQGERIEIEADVYVRDGQELNIGDMNLKFIHTPGHTKGSMCIMVNDEALITGDTLFEGSIGRTDFPGGSYQDMEKSLKKLKEFDEDIKIYAGHGNPTTIGKEKKYNMFMRQV